MNKNELSVNNTDRLTIGLKGLAGVAPFVGQLAGELIGNTIPNQRVDRIVEFVKELESRIAAVESCVDIDRSSDPEFADVMETAFFGAARALSEDRIRNLANLVATGIKADVLNYAETKHMLRLLEQLNDIEVILLRGMLPMDRGDYKLDAEFQKRHSTIICDPAIDRSSTNEEADQAAIRESYLRHLVSLGLLDDTHQVSRLGRMLLRHMEMMPEVLDYR